MSEAQNPDFVGDPDDLFGMPDQKTLDAVNRGIRAADEGRFVTSEEALSRVAKWLADLAARKPR